jgi:hypothetical protein
MAGSLGSIQTRHPELDRFVPPRWTYDGADPDGFMTRDEITSRVGAERAASALEVRGLWAADAAMEEVT